MPDSRLACICLMRLFLDPDHTFCHTSEDIDNGPNLLRSPPFEVHRPDRHGSCLGWETGPGSRLWPVNALVTLSRVRGGLSERRSMIRRAEAPSQVEGLS